jgi:hypothetical protein
MSCSHHSDNSSKRNSILFNDLRYIYVVFFNEINFYINSKNTCLVKYVGIVASRL